MTTTELSLPPMVHGLPWIGSLFDMAKDPLEFLYDTSEVHRGLCRFKLAKGEIYLVTRPDDLRYVLQENAKNYIRGTSVDLIRPMLGNGLALSDPPLWLRQRRTMQPLFNRSKLPNTIAPMVAIANRYTQRWLNQSQVLARQEMMHLTRDVIVATMFSDSLSGDTTSIDKAFADIERHVARYMYVPFRVPDWLPTPDNKRFKSAIATLDEIVSEAIAERTSEHCTKEDLLTALLHAKDPESGEKMSLKQVRDEVMTIYFAGHETTANLLTWTIAQLSQFPAVEQKMREEINRASLGSVPTIEQLNGLVYCNAVLREVLRLYPPAWMFARMTIADDTISGFRVPAGRTLFVVPWVTHRLPAYWANPTMFDPERFLRDETLGPLGLGGGKNWAYVPFGGGPHVCIGNHFAIAEALIVLATALPKLSFRVINPQNVTPKPSATLQVRDDLPVSIVHHH